MSAPKNKQFEALPGIGTKDFFRNLAAMRFDQARAGLLPLRNQTPKGLPMFRKPLPVAMAMMAMLVVAIMPACQSVAPLTPVVLQIADDDLLSKGTITKAQHDAAAKIIATLNADLADGTLTTQEQTDLLQQAAIAINDIYFPPPVGASPRHYAGKIPPQK